jgi:membrane fusion protein, multidrug efflux system
MKKQPTMRTLHLFIFAALIVGCQPQTEMGMPEDLPGLRSLLQEKKASLKALNQEISLIEEKISILDTNITESVKLVTTIHPRKKDFRHFVTIQGSVQSDDIVNASSEISGRITKLLTDEGKYVQKDELIATIDVESVVKQIAEVETSLALANDVYERQARLWEQKIGSEIQYLQAKNNKERLEKSLETLQFQLTKANVYAPISGAVDKVFLKEGELAAPGAPVVQILSTSRLKVVADAPENLLRSIKPGDRVEVVFPALQDTVMAKINLLGRQIDAANRTFGIEMQVSNRSGLLKPNLLAEIRVNDFTEKDVFVVPLELVQQEVGGRDFIMIKSADGDQWRAEKLYIETGDSYGSEIVIKSGLKEDHELIMTGARGLTHRELIEIAHHETTR